MLCNKRKIQPFDEYVKNCRRQKQQQFYCCSYNPVRIHKSDPSNRFDPDAHIGFAAVREREVGNQLRRERFARRLVRVETVNRLAHRLTVETGQT